MHTQIYTLSTGSPGKPQGYPCQSLPPIDWSRSGSVRVRPILAEPAPEHRGSVRPVVAPEPAPKVQVQGGSVQVRTGVHQGSWTIMNNKMNSSPIFSHFFNFFSDLSHHDAHPSPPHRRYSDARLMMKDPQTMGFEIYGISVCSSFLFISHFFSFLLTLHLQLDHNHGLANYSINRRFSSLWDTYQAPYSLHIQAPSLQIYSSSRCSLLAIVKFGHRWWPSASFSSTSTIGIPSFQCWLARLPCSTLFDIDESQAMDVDEDQEGEWRRRVEE